MRTGKSRARHLSLAVSRRVRCPRTGNGARYLVTTSRHVEAGGRRLVIVTSDTATCTWFSLELTSLFHVSVSLPPLVFLSTVDSLAFDFVIVLPDVAQPVRHSVLDELQRLQFPLARTLLLAAVVPEDTSSAVRRFVHAPTERSRS